MCTLISPTAVCLFKTETQPGHELGEGLTGTSWGIFILLFWRFSGEMFSRTPQVEKTHGAWDAASPSQLHSVGKCNCHVKPEESAQNPADHPQGTVERRAGEGWKSWVLQWEQRCWDRRNKNYPHIPQGCDQVRHLMGLREQDRDILLREMVALEVAYYKCLKNNKLCLS